MSGPQAPPAPLYISVDGGPFRSLWESAAYALRTRAIVNRFLALLIALATTLPLLAQQSGSKYRKEYEKEKNGPHGDCRTDWTTLQPGLDYRAIRCLGDEDDLDVHVVRIDLDRWDLDTAVVDRATARMIADNHEAAFDINANFFDKSRRAIGAVIRDGEIINAPHPSSWQSIFLIDDGGTPRIIMPGRWSSYRDRSQMAVQAGPRLVIAGHTNRSLRNNYAAPRAGVCIRNNGDLVFFATPASRKFQITEMAAVARRDDVDGGLACRDAMLFDGGHSVNFYAEGDERRISIEGDPVPVHIFATPHDESAGSQTK